MQRANHHQQDRRHVRLPHRTTIRLEQAFLEAIERLAAKAGTTCQAWVANSLTDKPKEVGLASLLRVRCLIQSTQGA